MYKFELYCGISNKDLFNNNKSSIDFFKEIDFLLKTSKNLDLDITVVPSIGSYTGETSFLMEDSLIVIIINSFDKQKIVKQLAYLYKKEFNQEAVLFTQSKINSELI
jgi:hypothetical protein